MLEECYMCIETHPNFPLKSGENSLCVYRGLLDKLGMFIKKPEDVVKNEFLKKHYGDKDLYFLCSFFEKYDEGRGTNYDKVSWYMAAYRSLELLKSHRSDKVCKKLLIHLLQNFYRVSEMKQKLYDVIPDEIISVVTVNGRLHSVVLVLWGSGYVPVKF